MGTTIVRYTLKPERMDEHLALIDAVFVGLAEIDHPGIHYTVFRSEEGTDFTHIAAFDDQDAREAFNRNDAFAAFTADIGERCSTPPHAVPQLDVAGTG